MCWKSRGSGAFYLKGIECEETFAYYSIIHSKYNVNKVGI